MNNNRIIKFRLWDDIKHEYHCYDGLFLATNFLGLKSKTGWYNNPETRLENYVIQQFTGLYDSKGKEIYEGDIVKYIYTYNFNEESLAIHEVKFSDGCFWPLPKDDIVDGDDFYSTRIKNYEIIGNIFENPSLLN